MTALSGGFRPGQDVETGTRTYWQDDVIREDGDEAAAAGGGDATRCVSETQKRQRTAAGPGPWTQWFGAYAHVECSHVQTRVRWEAAGGTDVANVERCQVRKTPSWPRSWANFSRL